MSPKGLCSYKAALLIQSGCLSIVAETPQESRGFVADGSLLLTKSDHVELYLVYSNITVLTFCAVGASEDSCSSSSCFFLYHSLLISSKVYILLSLLHVFCGHTNSIRITNRICQKDKIQCHRQSGPVWMHV